MSGTTFDALAAAGTLREAGFEDRQAEAVAGVVRHATRLRGRRFADRGALATKADIAALRADHAALRADTRADIAALRADLDTGLADLRADHAETRADLDKLETRLTVRFFGGLFGMGGVLVAVMAGLKLFG